MTDILLAEDDAEIREWVTYALQCDQYTVRAAADGEQALVAYRERRPDLLILDVMMPKKSGYDVLLWLRERDRQLPVMMLTAKATESDKVQGLGLGADDYMTKPFGVRELRARVAALLRRAGTGLGGEPDEVFAFGGWTVRPAQRAMARADGAPQDLSQLEMGVLRFLAAHPHEVVSRDSLLNGLWGVAYAGTNRTLDNRILSLRKKLGEDGVCIETVYGSGYRYRPPSPPESDKA